MKRINIILVTLVFSISAFSQGFKIPDFYVQREIKAPQAVKDRLALARREIADKNLKYVVGYTSVADKPIEKITGFRKPTLEQEKQIMDRININILKSRNTIGVITEVKVEGELPWPGNPYVYGNPAQSKLDLREAGLITSVRDQGAWGSCWAFSAMASYESSYRILTKKTINTSEEYVVNCSGGGDWGGGWMSLVFDWMVKNQKNVADESAVPYTGPPQTCPGGSPSAKYYAADWGLADPAKPINTITSVPMMKEAICKYGAISTALSVTESFKLYAGGVFYSSGPASGPVNHGVVIIGWDDSNQCWLIKNSWGTDWGSECGYGTERGYMWINYNSSNVGAYSAWVRASTIVHN